MKAKDVVVNLVSLNSKSVDRMRLQREAYLLSCCCVREWRFSFNYYHNGPYSREIEDGCVEAQAQGAIRIEERFSDHHHIPYSVLKNGKNMVVDRLSEDVCERLNMIRETSEVVLEIAASIVFFQNNGYDPEAAIEELRVRKPLKAAREGRIEQAITLIKELGCTKAS